MEINEIVGIVKPLIPKSEADLKEDKKPSGLSHAIGYIFTERFGIDPLKRISIPAQRERLPSVDTYLNNLGISDQELFKQSLAMILVGLAFPKLMRAVIEEPFSTSNYFEELNPILRKVRIKPPHITLYCYGVPISDATLKETVNRLDSYTSSHLRSQVTDPQRPVNIGHFFSNASHLIDLPSINELAVVYGQNKLIPDILVAGQIFQEVLDAVSPRKTVTPFTEAE